MFNPRVSSLSKSTTLKITALTKQLIREGKDVVNFAAGEPDFGTPSFIKEGAKRAIDDEYTKYTPSIGLVELRDAIAAKLRQENKIPCENKNLIVTSGAKYAIFVTLLGLTDTTDEVIICSPYWVSYPQMVKLTGAKIKILPTTQKDNFKINIEALKNAITSKTKLLILNYPNNPTGITYTRRELEEINSVIKENNILVISDEIYEKLVYDDKKHISFASLEGASKYTITINGFSKAFSMTGWRLGYLAAEENIIKEISKIIDHTTSCACSVSQKAALTALTDQQWQKELKETFQKRRNLLYEELKSSSKIVPFKPEGTFYMFCDIRKSGLTSLDFSSQLLDKHLVSSIPADSFGAEGFIRLSFSTSLEQIKKGATRIKEFLNGI